ncbi:MAG TPA: DUF763 domain-containing protein [Myxococcaceae bacterium]|nr:DUF763 domain-containing protein [Myxococcaceae bacterium]
MGRSGTASLPLHGGRVPVWLAGRMARLGRILTEAIVHHYGRDEFLRRLSHPFWFQAFGSVMGMDWHSSGITTSVLGALKRGLAPISGELGIYICGGRGKHSRQTPSELISVGDRVGVDGAALARASRLVAKVDSAAVQDGYQLYLHGFVVTADGHWTVVQQGMNTELREARRYHWLSDGLRSFVDEPHAAIDGHPHGEILNLTDHRAAPARNAQVALATEPEVVVRELMRLRGAPPAPHLSMPAHHEVTASDVLLRRLTGTLAAAAENGPKDFPELLLTPGVGPRTVQALALVAEVVHGTASRFSDPARFSYAHGGKDRHPFPVPLRVYDETIRVMRQAVDQARLGNDERLSAIRRLDREARRLERVAKQIGPDDFDALVAQENRESHAYGGMSVFGPAAAPEPAPLQERASESKHAAFGAATPASKSAPRPERASESSRLDAGRQLPLSFAGRRSSAES